MALDIFRLKHLAKKLIIYCLALLVTILVFFPIAWMITYSLRPNSQVFEIPPSFFPRSVTARNYLEMWKIAPFHIYFRNSFLVSLSSTILVTTIACLAAYSISRFRYPGRRVLSVFLLGSQLFPVVVLLVPLFLLFNLLRLYDNLLALVLSLTAITLPFSIFLLIGFFDETPKELEEAAYIDGASNMQVLLLIVVPLIAPGLAAAAIYTFITSWQEFLFALSFTASDGNRTLPVGLMYFFGQFQTNYAGLMAASTLVSLPTIIIFLFLQSYFIRGLTAGATKG